MSTAKRSGGISSLYPEGDIMRCNYELSLCITKAMIILGYMELPEEDQPDESIWNHPEKLEMWFDEVKNKRANPGREKVDNEWDNVELEQNEYAADVKKKMGIK